MAFFFFLTPGSYEATQQPIEGIKPYNPGGRAGRRFAMPMIKVSRNAARRAPARHNEGQREPSRGETLLQAASQGNESGVPRSGVRQGGRAPPILLLQPGIDGQFYWPGFSARAALIGTGCVRQEKAHQKVDSIKTRPADAYTSSRNHASYGRPRGDSTRGLRRRR